VRGARPSCSSAAEKRDEIAPSHQAIPKAFGPRLVDMTLRLDNAAALPTCPQPQQQQQTALFAA